MDNGRRRSNRLHDVARRLGVEVTHEVESVGDAGQPIFKYPFRPRLDIAHECLGKLPVDGDIVYQCVWCGDNSWLWAIGSHVEKAVSFEEAVIALAERFLATESRGDS